MLSPGILNTLLTLSHHCRSRVSRHHFPLLTLSSLLSQRLGSDGPVILILVLSNLDQFQIQIKLILYRNVWYLKNIETLTITRHSITAFGSLSIRNSEEIHSLYSHGSKDGPDGQIMDGTAPTGSKVVRNRCRLILITFCYCPIL